MDSKRREFLHRVLKGTAAAGVAGITLSNPSSIPLISGKQGGAFANSRLDILSAKAKRARFWISTEMENISCSACHETGEIENGESYSHDKTIIQCQLCAQNCIIDPGKRGKCRARINFEGELRSLVYGYPVTVHIDPIEKKPFYHFLPSSAAFSLATAGCPLHCKFCQNWQLSQLNPEDYNPGYTLPETIVEAAIMRNAPVIAYTYNEPTVFTEYMLDIANAGKKEGLKNVLISCGFMNPEPLSEMCEALDAIKIDLKGYNNDFYQRVCDAELQPVLNSIRQVAKSDTHLEIVNLIVPSLNDSDEMLYGLAHWIFNEVGPDVPVHFTRFHPDYQLLNLAPTPISTLERARQIALDEGIRFPFVGNVPGHDGNNTYCPKCGKTLVLRSGFFIEAMNIKNGKCVYCSEDVAGVWD